MRAKTALAKMEVNSLLQSKLTKLTEEREIIRYLLSNGKVILNIETKLECLEIANEKLADVLEQREDASSKEEF